MYEQEHSNIGYVVKFTGNNIRYELVRGGQSFDNQYGLDLFEYNGSLTEGRTGLRMCFLDGLDNLIKEHTIEEIENLIQKHINKYGISPRYSRPNETRKEALAYKKEYELKNKESIEKMNAEYEAEYNVQEQERERVRAEERAKQQAEETEYCNKQNQIASEIINNTIQAIINGGKIRNSDVTLYKSQFDYSTSKVFNYLAARYNVNFPIKFKGWVTKSLHSVEIKNNELGKYYLNDKKCNTSTTIYEHFDELIQAIVKAEQIKTA